MVFGLCSSARSWGWLSEDWWLLNANIFIRGLNVLAIKSINKSQRLWISNSTRFYSQINANKPAPHSFAHLFFKCLCRHHTCVDRAKLSAAFELSMWRKFRSFFTCMHDRWEIAQPFRSTTKLTSSARASSLQRRSMCTGATSSGDDFV